MQWWYCTSVTTALIYKVPPCLQIISTKIYEASCQREIPQPPPPLSYTHSLFTCKGSIELKFNEVYRHNPWCKRGMVKRKWFPYQHNIWVWTIVPDPYLLIVKPVTHNSSSTHKLVVKGFIVFIVFNQLQTLVITIITTFNFTSISQQHI